MTDSLPFFAQPELEKHWTLPVPTGATGNANPAKAVQIHLPLTHPYSRYGLAVALYQQKLQPSNLDEAKLRAALADTIEASLSEFRMRTGDDPSVFRTLTFSPVPLSALRNDANLVQSSGLASKGIYIYPSVVTTDGTAKDTFKNAEAVIAALRGDRKIDATQELSRSFAPTTAKINNGSGSQTPPKGTLLEVACALVTTLTPLKPAAWPGQNTVIIPDIALEEMLDFIELFEQMTINQRGDLMTANLPPPAAPKNPAKSSKTKDVKPKSEFRRPRLHSGNYPFALRDAGIFGAVGLLGAIGRWANSANVTPWAARVLESLAGQPLYIVSYDKISQVRFGHHIVNLALNGRLSEIIDTLWRDVQLYADLDSPRINRQNPSYQLFYLQTSRFLQLFSVTAFRDFLAARAEYPTQFEPLLREFFTGDEMRIPIEVVNSAGVLGQWLNRTAYFVADSEIDAGASDRRAKVQKTKAKILVEFESAAMSAKDPVDMLFRISTRAGRLLQSDMPAEAKSFMDAVASGDISQQQGVWLLVAYMRIRAPKRETGEVTPDETLAPISTDSAEETLTLPGND
jgi:hypothetical protein